MSLRRHSVVLLKPKKTAFGTFSARADCIYSHWVIPMLGGGPDGHNPHPPVARRVSEIRAASVQLPRAGAVSLWRCSLGRGHFYHPAKCYYAIRPWEIPRPECTLKTPSTQGGETCLCSSRMHRIPIPA